MENWDWNWQQIIGLALLIVGGICGFLGGLVLLSRLLSSKYSFVILSATMLLIGAILWVYGNKKGGSQ